jgi:diacylglycerol kinase (ATP)
MVVMAKESSAFSWQKRLKSFTYAGEGMKALFKTEHNAYIHGALTVMALLFAVVLHISRTEWMVLLLATAMVWITEVINTALEKTMDLISEEVHPVIKQVKDLAAAAVLVAAIMAVVIGLLIFIPKLF